MERSIGVRHTGHEVKFRAQVSHVETCMYGTKHMLDLEFKQTVQQADSLTDSVSNNLDDGVSVEGALHLKHLSRRAKLNELHCVQVQSLGVLDLFICFAWISKRTK